MIWNKPGLDPGFFLAENNFGSLPIYA